MGIVLNPELERRIARKIESGEFSSADEVIGHSLDLLDGRNNPPLQSPEEEPIWQTVIRLGQQIPEEDLADIPNDLSTNHDHYLYGAPKVQESAE